MKAIEQSFVVELFAMLCRVVLTCLSKGYGATVKHGSFQ